LRTTIKPSLGLLFSQFLDLHVLLSTIPKTRQDAELLHGQEGSNHTTPVEYSHILEVLQDSTPNLSSTPRSQGRNFGAREKRWGAFEVVNEGVGLVNAFGDSGTMKWIELSREDVRASNVGSVAKNYGFGDGGCKFDIW
jgi:hypothetical protein